MLAPGAFFGFTSRAVTARGFALSHRIADRDPEEIETHTHADAHFILVTGGSYLTAAQRDAGAPGTLVYNPVGTTHRDRFEPGLGSYFAISVSPADAVELCGRLSSAPVSIHERNPRAIAAALARDTARGMDALHLESLCMELLGVLGDRSPLSRSMPDWLKRACAWIEDCYNEDLELRDIARGVGVHPIHLARGFRAHFRCTAAEYLLRRRLEAAAQLLIRTPLALAEVALAAGFADQSHFTRRFGEFYGLAPGAYRRCIAASHRH